MKKLAVKMFILVALCGTYALAIEEPTCHVLTGPGQDTHCDADCACVTC
jgi:hypothetical protein